MPEIDLALGSWLNEPPDWALEDGALRLGTGDRTDFWQGTWYGFHRDDGHFLHVPARGDFTASVAFEGAYRTLYDQAGLMLRLDARNWIKLGIEHAGGVTNFSMVVTRGQSDWAVVGRPAVTGPQAVRITRRGGAVVASFRDAGRWQLLRVAPFPEAGEVMVGPMACSPEREGFEARFTGFRIDPPLADALHG